MYAYTYYSITLDSCHIAEVCWCGHQWRFLHDRIYRYASHILLYVWQKMTVPYLYLYHRRLLSDCKHTGSHEHRSYSFFFRLSFIFSATGPALNASLSPPEVVVPAKVLPLQLIQVQVQEQDPPRLMLLPLVGMHMQREEGRPREERGKRCSWLWVWCQCKFNIYKHKCLLCRSTTVK